MTDMSRRNFLIATTAGLTTLVINPTSVLLASSESTLPKLAEMLRAFPMNTEFGYNSGGPDRMQFFMAFNDQKNDDVEMSFSINKVILKDDTTYTANELIEKLSAEMPILDDDYVDTSSVKALQFTIERASNKIARSTHRGRGNYYFYDSENKDLILFYGGTSIYDTPIQASMQFGYSLNPVNYNNYFCKIKNVEESLFKQLLDELGDEDGILVGRTAPYTKYIQKTREHLQQLAAEQLDPKMKDNYENRLEKYQLDDNKPILDDVYFKTLKKELDVSI